MNPKILARLALVVLPSIAVLTGVVLCCLFRFDKNRPVVRLLRFTDEVYTPKVNGLGLAQTRTNHLAVFELINRGTQVVSLLRHQVPLIELKTSTGWRWNRDYNVSNMS